MNLLSGVCVALAAGLVVLITGHLIEERNRLACARARPASAGLVRVRGRAMGERGRAPTCTPPTSCSSPSSSGSCSTWAAAPRGVAARRPLAGRSGPRLRPRHRRPPARRADGLRHRRLAPPSSIGDLAPMAAGRRLRGDDRDRHRAYGLHLGPRHHRPRAAPVLRAPRHWERFRYLVFAEQFRDLFEDFSSPLADFWRSGAIPSASSPRSSRSSAGCSSPLGAAILAVRASRRSSFLGLSPSATVLYAMNFRDGDIDRYYLPTIALAAPLIGVASRSSPTLVRAAVAEIGRRLRRPGDRRRRGDRVGGRVVVALGVRHPGGSASWAATGHTTRARTGRRTRGWHRSTTQLPPNAVIISWWSYSTPLWYHRWILGERPDVTIIDERNILDDGYRTMRNAIRPTSAGGPVYVVPPTGSTRPSSTWETSTATRTPGTPTSS